MPDVACASRLHAPYPPLSRGRREVDTPAGVNFDLSLDAADTMLYMRSFDDENPV